MKTPREILLARHRAAEPKLDAIREAVLAEALNVPAPGQPAPRPSRAGVFSVGMTLWRELILPSRRAWSGRRNIRTCPSPPRNAFIPSKIPCP